jgi:hypothetical protein
MRPFLLVFLLAAFLLPSELAAAARLEVVGGATVDLGRVRPGSMHATVLLTNSGSDTLTGVKAYSGCGCLAAMLDGDRIAPGDTVRLSLVADATNYDGDLWQKGVDISTGGEAPQHLQLIVRFVVLHDFRVDQTTTIVRERVIAGTRVPWNVTVRNTSDTLLTIGPPITDELRGTLVHYRKKKAMTIPPGGSATLEMTVEITGGVDVALCRVLLPTSSPYEKEIWLGYYRAP